MGGLGAMMAAQPGVASGMAQVAKEASKLEGVPVLQVVRIGGAAGAAGQTETAQAQPEKEQADPAPANRIGRFGGLAGGGMPGFGRKKKQPEEQQQASASQNATPPGTLMELTTEMTAFSSAPVDAAKLTVPAGFKQVEHQMKKGLK